MRTLAALALAAAALPAAAAAPAVNPMELCALLATADFRTAGFLSARAPTMKAGDRRAVCIFAAKEPGMAGIELEAYAATGDADASKAFKKMRPASAGAAAAPPSVDEYALWRAGGAARIAARKGKLVFGISVPDAPEAEKGLADLAAAVVKRGGAFVK